MFNDEDGVRLVRGTHYVHYDGVLPEHEDCECEFCGYAEKKKKCATIRSLLCDDSGFTWTFETDIPHSTFDIFENGNKFCRGIVINSENLPKL